MCLFVIVIPGINMQFSLKKRKHEVCEVCFNEFERVHFKIFSKRSMDFEDIAIESM